MRLVATRQQEVDMGQRMTPLRPAVPLLALALACGTLETPDLQHGAVSGRISGAQQGAYAYVLGAPDVYAPIAADGTFHLDHVPSGGQKIVLFDGSTRAGTCDVEVQGGNIAEVTLASSLPLASAILAAARPATSVSTSQLTFTITGTRLRDVKADSSGVARLWPVPPGSFTLRASLPGFREALVSVDLPEGVDQSEELSLEIDSESEEPGCKSSGGCEPGFECEDDGECAE